MEIEVNLIKSLEIGDDFDEDNELEVTILSKNFELDSSVWITKEQASELCDHLIKVLQTKHINQIEQ